MKNIVRQIALFGCFSGAAFAAPFLAIGDNAELFVTGTAGVRSDSNIELAPNNLRKDDVITQFIPGLELNFGKDALVKGVLTAQETLNSYAKNSQFNAQLGVVAFEAHYDNGKLQLGSNASYTQLDQNTYSANGTNIRRDLSALGVNGEYSISDKTKIGSAVTYSETNYPNAGGVNDKTYGVPVNVYYAITPKVDLSGGVSYTRSELGDQTNYDDYYYNVGARGDFTAKLEGSFSVGYNDRKGSGISTTSGIAAPSDSGLGLRSALVYHYTDKTVVRLDGSRDFSNGATGASQQSTAVTLSGQSAIATAWRANVGITYRVIDFKITPSRTDDYFEGSMGATYVINSNLSVNGSYIYRSNSSDSFGNSFIGNIVSLSISARY